MASNGASGGEEILDTARAGRGVWLIKIPKAVGEGWKKGGVDGGGTEPFGLVRMSVDPLKGAADPSTEFSFHVVGKGVVKDFPLDFSLNRTSVMPMHVFSETPQGKLALEGKVDQKFDMQPRTDDATYRAFVKNREKQFNTPKRTLQVIVPASTTPLPMNNPLRHFGKNLPPPVKASDKKNVRMDGEALQTLLFRLFEGQPYWGMRQLTEATQQPTSFLKETLTTLCNYNRRGNHQGMYELKDEYKKHVQDDNAAT